MARAYASIILKAPVETVWSLVRDFNGLPPGPRQSQNPKSKAVWMPMWWAACAISHHGWRAYPRAAADA